MAVEWSNNWTASNTMTQTIYVPGGEFRAVTEPPPPPPTDVAKFLDEENKLYGGQRDHVWEEAIRERREQGFLRATSFLADMLTHDQSVETTRYRRFHVTLKNGHRYRFNPFNGECFRMRKFNGKWVPAIIFCIHPRDGTPAPDRTIMHMTMLAASEKEFLQIANHTPTWQYMSWLKKRGYVFDCRTKRPRKRSKDRWSIV